MIRWHQSHKPAAIPRLPARTRDAIAARNKAAADLAAALPKTNAARRLMTARGVFVERGTS